MTQTHSRSGRIRLVPMMIIVTLILTLSWLGLELHFALTAEPARDVDHGRRLMDLAVRWQGGEDSENAWPAVFELSERWKRLPGGYVNEADWAATYGNAWIFWILLEDHRIDPANVETRQIPSGLTPEQAQASLDANRVIAMQALDSWDAVGLDEPLDVLIDTRHIVRPLGETTQNPILVHDLSDLPNVRGIAFALRLKMIQCRDTGDWESYIRRFEQILALGRVYRWQASLVENSIGSAVRSQAIEQVRTDLMARKIPSEFYQRIAQAMDRQSCERGLFFAIEGSRAESLIVSQWTHTNRGRLIISEVDAFMGNGVARSKYSNMLSVFYARRSDTDAWINAYYDEVKRWYDVTPSERRSMTWPFQIPESAHDEDASPVAKVRYWNIPALGRIRNSYEQTNLEELGIRTQIAIESFRARSGVLPETLGDLIPSDLEELPVDPLADGRAALGYMRLASPDEYGREYILYSVGGDGEDNLGKPGYEGATLYGNNLDGTDFILNPAH